jgi:hypothetical protein
VTNERPGGRRPRSAASLRTELLRERLEGVLSPAACDVVLAEAGWNEAINAPTDPWLRALDWVETRLVPVLAARLGDDVAGQLAADLRHVMASSGVMRLVLPSGSSTPPERKTTPPVAARARPAAYMHTASAESATELWSAFGAYVDLLASEDGARVAKAVASSTVRCLVVLDRRKREEKAAPDFPAGVLAGRHVIVWADDASEVVALRAVISRAQIVQYVVAEASPREVALICASLLGVTLA